MWQAVDVKLCACWPRTAVGSSTKEVSHLQQGEHGENINATVNGDVENGERLNNAKDEHNGRD